MTNKTAEDKCHIEALNRIADEVRSVFYVLVFIAALLLGGIRK